MYLFELFDDRPLVDSLRSAAVNILTPLLANKVPFVTVQSMIDSLRDLRPGILVDRALIMNILDPAKIKSISKIQGDRIYLQSPDDETVENSKRVEQNQEEKVAHAAIDQAKKEVSKQ